MRLLHGPEYLHFTSDLLSVKPHSPLIMCFLQSLHMFTSLLPVFSPFHFSPPLLSSPSRPHGFTARLFVVTSVSGRSLLTLLSFPHCSQGFVLSHQLKVHFGLKWKEDVMPLALVQFSRTSCMGVYQPTCYNPSISLRISREELCFEIV